MVCHTFEANQETFTALNKDLQETIGDDNEYKNIEK